MSANQPDKSLEVEKLSKELMPSFTRLADSITKLYRAVGNTRRCGIINGLWYPVEPGMGIDFIPTEVRGKLETLITEAGINLCKNNGDRGE